MPSAPVLKRYYRGECTRCGRPCDAVVWCRRCCDTAAQHGLRHAHTPGWWMSDAEWLAYRAALLEWAKPQTSSMTTVPA